MTTSKYRKYIFLAFSAACVIALFTCSLVNAVIDKQLTWAFYPLLSIPFGWLILSPLTVRKYGVLLSLCSTLLFILPFLFLLEKITPYDNWFVPLGIPCAIAGFILAVLFYILFRFIKINIWYKLAVTVIIAGAIASPIIDSYVNRYLNEGPKIFQIIINVSASVILATVLIIIGYRRGKAKKIRAT